VHNLDNVAEVSLTVDSNTILINNMIPNADCKTTPETKKKLQTVSNKSETINKIKLNRRGIIKKAAHEKTLPLLIDVDMLLLLI